MIERGSSESRMDWDLITGAHSIRERCKLRFIGFLAQLLQIRNGL